MNPLSYISYALLYAYIRNISRFSRHHPPRAARTVLGMSALSKKEARQNAELLFSCFVSLHHAPFSTSEQIAAIQYLFLH